VITALSRKSRLSILAFRYGVGECGYTVRLSFSSHGFEFLTPVGPWKELIVLTVSLSAARRAGQRARAEALLQLAHRVAERRGILLNTEYDTHSKHTTGYGVDVYHKAY
jgi:hypothetical protein